MLKKLKNYKIIFIKENGLYAKELRSKHFIIPSIILFSLFLAFSSLILFSTEIREIISLKVVSKHIKNNHNLNAMILDQEKKIEFLKHEIDNIYKEDEKLRKLIKLPSIDKDIRKLGVGGNESKDKYNEVNYLIPGSFNLDAINNDIEYLMRSINLEKLSFSTIEKNIISNKDKILKYPAIYPVEVSDRKFSSRYGYRIDPFSKKKKFHDGDDFSTKIGVDVFATADGIVQTSRYNGSFGNYIEIDHGNGYITAYGHLSKRAVKKGQKIDRGDFIGKVGNTGKSTAPHLHYEIRLNDKHVNPNKYYFN